MRQIHSRDKIRFPLFRFTALKYANCFFKTGQLRLGTLFDYAKNERYGDAIHDRHEGYCAFMMPKEKSPYKTQVARLTLARNNLALCLSEQYDDALYGEFDANCCIQINDGRFFKCIDSILQVEFTEPLLRQVVYIDKSKWECMPDYEDFAGVIKDIKFRPQSEVRALWEPREKHLQKVEIPAIITKDPWIEGPDSLIQVSEEKWFKAYAKQECKSLSPRTIFVPEAIKYCSLIRAA